MKKLLILLLTITIAKTYLGCCKEKGYNFRWRNFKLTNIDLSTDRPAPMTATTTSFSKYGIRMDFQNERVALQRNNFSFNQAYAFDCNAHFANKDTIIAIDVIDRNSFDATHPANSSVYNYMEARATDFYNYYPTDTYKHLSNILPFLNESQDKAIHNNSIDLRFKNVTVPNLGPHRFVVSVIFSNGRMIQDSTSVEFN